MRIDAQLLQALGRAGTSETTIEPTLFLFLRCGTLILVLLVGVGDGYAHRFELTDDHDAGYWLLDHVDDGASDDCCPGLFSKGGK